MLNLQKKQYTPVYFLTGEEPYFIDKVADYVTAHILDESEKAFDQQVLYGRDFQDIGPIITQARQFPMGAPYQVLVVREAQMIKKWENFEKYWTNPAPQTILCICYKGKANKTHKCFKDINELPGYMESQALRDYQVNKWIDTYIRNWNTSAHHTSEVTISPSVVQLLADSLGSDLTRIEMELKKLVDGCPEGTKEIDAAMVERNIGISKDYNVFELQKALIVGDVVKANRIVRYFASGKDHAIQAELPILFTFFSNLMLYHYLPSKNEQDVAKALGINKFFVKDYAQAARRYSQGKTFRIISYIREADARSKGIDTAPVTNLDLWQELIYKILH